jgi:hypothetical protein
MKMVTSKNGALLLQDEHKLSGCFFEEYCFGPPRDSRQTAFAKSSSVELPAGDRTLQSRSGPHSPVEVATSPSTRGGGGRHNTGWETQSPMRLMVRWRPTTGDGGQGSHAARVRDLEIWG